MISEMKTRSVPPLFGVSVTHESTATTSATSPRIALRRPQCAATEYAEIIQTMNGLSGGCGVGANAVCTPSTPAMKSALASGRRRRHASASVIASVVSPRTGRDPVW